MDFYKENLPVSEENSGYGITTDLELLNGAGIFSNREIKNSSHWSLPWSDLMMTMFILFCILYAYKTSNKEVTASPLKPEIIYQEKIRPVPKEDLTGLYEMSRETLRARDFKDVASVELTRDKAVKIILPSDILFDTGQAELKPDALGSLAAVGALLKDKNYAITVAGYTDNIPINTDRFPSNWELSTARACVAAKFLIDESDISPGQIQVVGYADNRPIASNETPEGRCANRRVEIIISKEQFSDNLNPVKG